MATQEMDGRRDVSTMVPWVIAGVLALALFFVLAWYLQSGPTEEQLAFDVEFNYVASARSWTQETGEDPFEGTSDQELMEKGRTVCLRATDDDMNFDGMSDILGTEPHQTYVLLAEAADKLCTGHSQTLNGIMEG
jgi:hypothetical protein